MGGDEENMMLSRSFVFSFVKVDKEKGEEVEEDHYVFKGEVKRIVKLLHSTIIIS